MAPKPIRVRKPARRVENAADLAKAVHRDGEYIDYLNGFRQPERMPISRFGIRIRDGRFWAIVQVGEAEPSLVGKSYSIPVDRMTLASFVGTIIDDYQRQYPNSDLSDVLMGRKSFREATRLGSSRRIFRG